MGAVSVVCAWYLWFGSVVVGGLVCGGCIGVEIWWTVSLVDWFVGCMGVEICGCRTLVSSESMSVLCMVGA